MSPVRPTGSAVGSRCQARSRNEKIIRYWSNLNSCEHTESQNGSYLLQVNYTSEAGSTEDTCVIIHSTARHNFPLYSYFTAQQQFLFIFYFFYPCTDLLFLSRSPIFCQRCYLSEGVKLFVPFLETFFLFHFRCLFDRFPSPRFCSERWPVAHGGAPLQTWSSQHRSGPRGARQRSGQPLLPCRRRESPLLWRWERKASARSKLGESFHFDFPLACVWASKVFVVKFYVPHATFFQAGLNANIQHLLKADGIREPAKNPLENPNWNEIWCKSKQF